MATTLAFPDCLVRRVRAIVAGLNRGKGRTAAMTPTTAERRPDEAVPAAVESRQRILAAAARNIAELGLARVRMATIAREAGVSTALLHYHFDTKERLFAEVLAYSYERSAELDQAALDRAGGSAAARLSAYLERCLPVDDVLA